MNPNFSPFYSIRFAPLQGGISGGASDIFEYTLPPQTDLNYIQSYVRLVHSLYYYAYLTTFGCDDLRPVADDRSATLDVGMLVFPNPAEDLLFVDVPGQAGGDALLLRVLDGKGSVVHHTAIASGAGPQTVPLPAGLPEGMYVLEVVRPEGRVLTQKFLIWRR